MNAFWQWIGEHALWLGLFSIVTFIGSLALIPVLVPRIPADYFIEKNSRLTGSRKLHPLLYVTLMVIKNALGILLLVAGIAMLVLPGQGIITALIGITLMNFPGKFALERYLVSQSGVFNAINWIRNRAGRPPLIHPNADTNRSA
jgi:hypothetical protein